MDITNIQGNTYYIKGGTNTGIYIYNDSTALIIDPGLGGLRPKRIIQALDDKDIEIKYIVNTHEHNDHYGACNQFKERYNDAKLLSSEYSKLYIERPELFSKYIMGGRSNSFMDGILKGKSLGKVSIDAVIEEGVVNLNEVDFNIIEFKGHTPGSIGVLTKDKVLFVGDLLIGDEILDKYDFLFLFDIADYKESLNKLKYLDFDYIVEGHGKRIIEKTDCHRIIEKHEKSIDKYLNQVRNMINEPITLENILKNIINNNKLSNNYKEYHFFKSSLVSLISHLIDLDEIMYKLSDGELLYYTKKK